MSENLYIDYMTKKIKSLKDKDYCITDVIREVFIAFNKVLIEDLEKQGLSSKNILTYERNNIYKLLSEVYVREV